MASVEAVKTWMAFFGWSNGGAPGAIKTVYGRSIVAYYGDDTWKSDVQEAVKLEDQARERDRQRELEAQR